MAKGLAARVSALEKAIAKIFSGKKAKVRKRKKATTRKPAKTARKKKTAPKMTGRNSAGSRRPTMEQIVPGGEPLFVTPMDQV
jgi:hypothetical protein